MAGSWFFRYPEILTAPIVVSTENLPFDIVAKTSKRIDTLMVAEKQRVNKNQLLGVLENSANTDDVLALESMLNDINISSPVSVYERNLDNRQYRLGELQPAYVAFVKSYEDLAFFLRTDY